MMARVGLWRGLGISRVLFLWGMQSHAKPCKAMHFLLAVLSTNECSECIEHVAQIGIDINRTVMYGLCQRTNLDHFEAK